MSKLTNKLTGLALAIIAIVGIMHDGQKWDPVIGLQNHLTAYRFQASKRPATGDIVFLAIDKAALEEVGQWPWPRRVHAKIIDRLMQHGAAEIALDIDFDSRSNPEDDKLLSEALERAGGSVVLAAFRQGQSVEQPAGKIAFNLPDPAFLRHAWPASVNVIADADGLVRRFPYGQTIATEFVPSLPSLLAGHSGTDNDTVVIDYSIDPSTIPTFSVKTLLTDKIPEGALAGKKVLLGAHAVELRDTLAVPVHAVLSGAVVQVLGAETLLQGRSLVQNSKTSTTILILAILVLGAFASMKGSLRTSVALLGATSLLTEGLAFALQIGFATNLITAPVHLATLLMACFFIVLELSSRQIKALRARIRAQNIQHILDRVFLDNFDAIIVADRHGRIEIASKKVQGILSDLDYRLCKGKHLEDVLVPAVAEEAQRVITQFEAGQFEGSQSREVLLGEDPRSQQVIEYVITPSQLEAQPSADKASSPSQTVICITARDVTSLKAHKDRLEYLSKRDHLTGAMRRDELINQIAASGLLSREAPGGSASALLVFDVQRFSVINGTFGRAIGDALLKEIAHRAACFDGEDHKVARVDGDAFAMLIEGCKSEAEARVIERRLLAELEPAYTVDGHRVHVLFDIGISGSWQGFLTPEEYLAAAEAALDATKRSVDAVSPIYDPSSAETVRRAQLIERHLWRAIEREELKVLYQPQVDLTDRTLVGAEALLRWESEELGNVSPAEFVPIAENSGSIEQIGRHVLQKACADAAQWPSEIAVAVNVSSVQIHRGNLLQDVDHALAHTGLPPERLHLELTETTILNHHEDTRAQIERLRARGITIALDDFGTGYCSFEYLSNLPIDKIKLDQSFVRNMLLETTSAAVIRSIMTLATGLSLSSIAEGIETEEQAVQLRLAGCRQGQGYLFSRPLPANQFFAKLSAAA